jgi:hypothetical protein
MRIVLTTRTVIKGRPVHAGAVKGPAGNGVLWLDLNLLGTWLPQIYGEHEVEDATPELLAKHKLCRDCSGYGLLDERTALDWPDPGLLCNSCGGSGSTEWRTHVTMRDGVIEGRIEPQQVQGQSS